MTTASDTPDTFLAHAPARALSARRSSSRVRQGRERILADIRAAAITEFSQNGLKGTSTQAIADRAGLTKPQLHYYITGKEELYNELLMQVLHDWKVVFAFDERSDEEQRPAAARPGSRHGVPSVSREGSVAPPRGHPRRFPVGFQTFCPFACAIVSGPRAMVRTWTQSTSPGTSTGTR